MENQYCINIHLIYAKLSSNNLDMLQIVDQGESLTLFTKVPVNWYQK